MKLFRKEVRLINCINRWHSTPIEGWIKHDGLVFFESKHLHTQNISQNTIDINKPVNKHQSINTLYSACTVCGFNFLLYKLNKL